MSYLLLSIFGIFSLCSALTIEKADRQFDLSGHLLKLDDKLLLLGDTNAAAEFEYHLPASMMDNVVFFDVSAKTGDKRERLVATEKKESGKKLWSVKLSRSLGNGERVNVFVSVVFANAILPYPREIKQSERQKTLYTGNLHLYSPYAITSETVKFSLASSQIESYTKVKPFSVSDSIVTYGPYENIKPFSEQEVSVHFENNSPFMIVKKMSRLVEISLWGSNVAVEEHYEVFHNGAELSGPFSRYDYQIHQDGVSSIKAFTTILPAAARDIYYRDEIGNISTSNVRQMPDGVEIEIRPRFPLFGGWKTVYYVGYNIPAHQFLYRAGSKYVLKMPFVDHVFDDQLIEEVTLKIVLPESSEILNFYPPYPVERRPNEVRNVFFDFTDSIKRPVVVIEGKNLIEQHIQDFTLEFNFNTIYLLRQPLLFMVACFSLFLTVIVVVRLDFAITRDEVAEAKMKASSHFEAIVRQVRNLKANYESLSAAIGQYRTTKDINALQLVRKKVENAWKAAHDELHSIREVLKSESHETFESVGELMKQDNHIRETLNKYTAMVEKFVAGKLDKNRYETEDKDYKNQIKDLVDSLDKTTAVFM